MVEKSNDLYILSKLLENESLKEYEERTGRALPKDYAKEYGRPSLDDAPYGCSENDGYPYLGEGHAPNCNGKIKYGLVRNEFGNLWPTKCWCDWVGWYPDGLGKRGH